MYEGPKLYGEDADYIDQDEPFDYVEHAKKLREEREAKEAEKKAEREAKEATKKAEKEARLAKKIADKATEKLEEKVDKLSTTKDDAKETIDDAKEEVAELKDALQQAAEAGITKDELPTPVEMTFTDGSEYIANLEDGEEAIFELSHAIDKVEETVELADEVQEQADALAKARAALDAVDAEHVGVSYEGQEINSVVFGDAGPQDDVRDRLRHTWEAPYEDSATTEAVDSEPTFELPSVDTTSSSSSIDGMYQPAPSAELPYSNSYLGAQPKEVEPTPIQRRTTSIKNSAAFVGSFFAGRASTSIHKLENADAVLQSETRDVQREMQTLQAQPIATREKVVLTPHETSSMQREVRGTNEPAIPSWISQVESNIKKGKVPELKKWQIDVLRAQHPDLLKKYEKLDVQYKEQIKGQSKEVIRGANTIFDRPAGTSEPGDLPSPAYSMPAYMISENRPANPKMPAPTYQYAPAVSAESYTVFSNEFLSVVIIGGMIFGAALIAVFGF